VTDDERLTRLEDGLAATIHYLVVTGNAFDPHPSNPAADDAAAQMREFLQSVHTTRGEP
jgi:hypothetical protein